MSLNKYMYITSCQCVHISLRNKFVFSSFQCPGADKLFNTHLVINSGGEIVSTYRKLHLFDVDIPGKVRLCESDFTLPGQHITPPVSTPAGNLALSIVSFYNVQYSTCVHFNSLPPCLPLPYLAILFMPLLIVTTFTVLAGKYGVPYVKICEVHGGNACMTCQV